MMGAILVLGPWAAAHTSPYVNSALSMFDSHHVTHISFTTSSTEWGRYTMPPHNEIYNI